MNEVRVLYHTLVRIGEDLHKGSHVSLGMRAVLEYLARNGRATVPDVPRARRVSRQRIQALVNALLQQGVVRSVSNPASKRSPLIALSAKGARTIDRMRAREAALINLPLDAQRLECAAATLRELRDALEQNA